MYDKVGRSRYKTSEYEMTEPDVIRFKAEVAKVQTLADGGIRVILDLPETAIDTATAMMQAKQAGAVLECAVVAIKND
jgi:predicted secreted protein